MTDEGKAPAPNWPLVGMTAEEAAASLRVDVRTVREAIKNGGLPARLVGRGWRIEESALRSWLASGTGEGRNKADGDMNANEEIEASFSVVNEALLETSDALASFNYNLDVWDKLTKDDVDAMKKHVLGLLDENKEALEALDAIRTTYSNAHKAEQ